ncbi:MAG: cysteine rich repeat-containing protein [Pseudomonadota bacterium]
MTRTILIVALLGLSGAAYAQDLTAEQRNACMGDYEKFCKGVAPGGGRIIACLSKSSDKLTAECKKVLTAAEKK